MNSIRNTFFEECEELLEALVEGLSAMEEDAGNMDVVNAVFRSVHSIKGGAGAFALDRLVSFAHAFETVMDKVRSSCRLMNNSCCCFTVRAINSQIW